MNGFEKIEQIFKRDILEAFFEAVKLHEDYLKELNNQQLIRGIDAKGQQITPPYTLGYKKTKAAKGLQTSVVDLKVTGDYHRSKQVAYYGTKIIEMFSEHGVKGFNLGEHLRERYGKDIEGLTKESEELFLERIMPDFIKLWISI